MSHIYLHNGMRKPSPTTILGDCIDKSGAMAQAAVNETLKHLINESGHNKYGCYYEVGYEDAENAKYHYKNIWKKQMTIGSITHKAIHIYLNNKFKFISSYAEVQNTMKAFLSFAQDFKLEPLHTEYQVYGNFCAGTVDLKCHITFPKGKYKGQRFKYILDWKTNKAFYGRAHMLQAAKYRQLDGDKLDGHCAVRLDKYSGEYEFKDGGGHYPRSRDTYKSDLRRFNAYMIAYMENHPKIAKGCNWKLPEVNKQTSFETVMEGLR